MELKKLIISIHSEDVRVSIRRNILISKIKNTDEKLPDKLESGLEVMFNPTTMQYSKEIVWIDSGSRKKELREKQYDLIKYKKLKMKLLFDFTMANNESFIDYKECFDFITSEKAKVFARDDDGKDDNRGNNLKRPPVLTLSWGNNPLFNLIGYRNFQSCIITKLNWSYEMFNRNGEVLRAIADITFEDIDYESSKTESDKNRRGKMLGRIKMQ